MKITDILTEAVSNVWYHNVDIYRDHVLKNLSNIANGGAYIAKTPQDTSRVPKRGNSNEPTLGISFTRDKNFSLNMKNFGYVVFEVDPAKIKQTNRVVPIDFFKADGEFKRSQVEEFVVGDIKEFARTVRAIHIFFKDPAASEDVMHDLEKTLMLFKRNYPHIQIIDKGKSLRNSPEAKKEIAGKGELDNRQTNFAADVHAQLGWITPFVADVIPVIGSNMSRFADPAGIGKMINALQTISSDVAELSAGVADGSVDRDDAYADLRTMADDASKLRDALKRSQTTA